jgi:predicted  nucleic acid-binding Zn-ribbon protein
VNEELTEKIQRLERDHTHEKEDWARKRREMQKELDFMTNEQNHKELELRELREKLRKREDELKDLKLNLNSQISTVVD